MKALNNLLAAGLTFVLAEGVYGQSSFSFHNFTTAVGLDAPVLDADGNRLLGAHFLAMLYGGPTADTLAPARASNPEFQMQPEPIDDLVNGQAGYFFRAGFVQFTSVPCGGLVWLEVRAWDSRLGATYEEVAAQGMGGYGESPLFQARGGFNCGLPQPPEPLRGLQSFSLRPIPEPSMVLLWLLGVSLVLFMRYRK